MNKRQFYSAIFIFLSYFAFADMQLFILPASGQTGKENVEGLIKILDNLQVSHSGVNQTQAAQAAKYIDYQIMAEQALGENNWLKLSSKQKAIYLQSFKSLIENRYYKRWHKIFAKSKISYNGPAGSAAEERKGDEVLVKTTITTDKSTKLVLWTLAGQPAKVINLTVEDKDILTRVQARFQRKITGAGIPAFLAWLQNKAKQSSSDDEDNLTAEDTSSHG